MQRLSYTTTGRAVNGTMVPRGVQDDRHKEWPLDTLPPPRIQVEWLGSGPDTYTFSVDGHPPWTCGRSPSGAWLPLARTSRGGGGPGAEDQVDAPQVAEPGRQGSINVSTA